MNTKAMLISLIAVQLLSGCLTTTTEPVRPVVPYKPPPPPVTEIIKKSLDPAKIAWVKQAVSQYLADPYTAQYKNIYMTEFWQDHKHVGNTFCGQVNAKNLYGAFTGYQWFGYFPQNKTKMLFETSSHTSDRDMIRLYCLNVSSP